MSPDPTLGATLAKTLSLSSSPLFAQQESLKAVHSRMKVFALEFTAKKASSLLNKEEFSAIIASWSLSNARSRSSSLAASDFP